MHTRLTVTFAAALVVAGAAQTLAQSEVRSALEEARREVRRALADARARYQGRRGPEQSDTSSRKIRLGRDGRVSIQNVAGDISVTAGPGEDLSIDAVKRTRGDRGELDRVEIIVDEHAGRVDVRTEYPRSSRDYVSVDYTLTVPESTAVELRSVSGTVKVTGVKGGVRAESISGNVTTANTPRVEQARTVSGDVDLTGVSVDGDLSVSSISGGVRAGGIKARTLDVHTVSGEISLRDATCDRLNARSVSGRIEYTGSLARNGRYDANSHSGGVRFTLAGNTGFDLSATSFSGSVRSEFPLTVGGERNPDVRRRGFGRRSEMRATFGDGSATLDLRTFSGDIVLARR